ncbi:class I SAM-dependent methyltransferase [Myxococcus sp. Y35]|uniref:class I SAM-dependent methyltransferase n=1 Tax=Pseudomyxococcus flavus TaxID=3115648 RepID=UPI003CF7A6A5
MAAPHEPPSLAQSLHFWARNASNESALLQASLRLGLFDALAVGDAATAPAVEQLAQRLGCSARGLRALLELLVCLGFVQMDDTRRFRLATHTAALLDDAVFQARLRAELPWWGPMGLLAEAVTSGEAVDVEGQRWDVLGHVRQHLVEPAPPTAAEQADFFDRFTRGGLRHQVLLAAGRLGVLEALARGPHSLEALGEATRTRSPGVLVEALAAMGLTRRQGEDWALSPEAAPVLEGKALAYLVRSLSVSARYWEALGRLDETVRHERYVLDLKDPEVSGRFYADNSQQITAVFASHFQLSRRAATTLASVRPLEEASVLDIGTGSGVWGAAFARASASTHVTYFDQAVVLEQVRRNVAKLEVADRARFWPGNLFTQDFGTADFDVIILPQVLNVLRPEDVPGLLARVARALRPGGILVIAEYVLNERRDGPLDHLYFGLRRFMTNEGDLFSASEYAKLLADAGLPSSVCIPLPTQELVFAARAGVPLPTALAAPPRAPSA